METFGYSQTEFPGVYKSQYILVRMITLISLNDLSRTPNNIMFKLFASKKREQHAVSAKIRKMIKDKQLPKALTEYFYNFIKILFKKGKEMEWLNLSPKEKHKWMRSIEDMVLEKMSIERRLKGLRAEDRLKGLRAEERLKGLRAEERLKGLRAEERLKGLRAEDRLKGLRAEDRLKGLRAEDRLKGLDIDIIEKYLLTLKRKKA